MKYYILLIISSILLCFDMFAAGGQPANMDGTTHIVNIASFYKALSEGNFPVGWTNNYANYGLPMGYFAQQTTSYLGATINLITHNPLLSFNLVYLIGVIVSTCLFYYFTRQFVNQFVALGGAFLFQLAPYRIINIYIRGALPEFFSSTFVLLILIALTKFAYSRKLRWLIINTVAIAGLILTHPMNVVTGGMIILPFLVWEITRIKNVPQYLFDVFCSSILGLALTGYYLAPLLLEIKYFYYGQMNSHFTPNSYLTLQNFISPQWPYFWIENNDIMARGHFIKVGLVETVLFVFTGLWLSFVLLKKKKVNHIKLILMSFLIGTASLFLTTPLSDWLYHHVFLLDAIQFPWRMLSSFIIIFPFTLALVIANSRHKDFLVICLIVTIIVARFGQIYGKNVARYDQSKYSFTLDNPHNIAMNPVWSGPSTSYPVKTVKGEIIEGKGVIVQRKELNAKREYLVEAATPLRMVDNTFYFPGWKVLIDGTETPIEYQDPNYRGVITYKVSEGSHNIKVVFSDTKVRIMGKIISFAGLLFLVIFTVGYRFIRVKKVDVSNRSQKAKY